MQVIFGSKTQTFNRINIRDSYWNNSEPILYISSITVYFPKIHLTFIVHTPSWPSKRLFLEISVLKFTGSGIHPASYPVASRSSFSRDKTAKMTSKPLTFIRFQDMLCKSFSCTPTIQIEDVVSTGATLFLDNYNI